MTDHRPVYCYTLTRDERYMAGNGSYAYATQMTPVLDRETAEAVLAAGGVVLPQADARFVDACNHADPERPELPGQARGHFTQKLKVGGLNLYMPSKTDPVLAFHQRKLPPVAHCKGGRK